MKELRANFLFEASRALRPRNLVILAIFTGVVLFFVHRGVNGYLVLEETAVEFKKLQEKQFGTIKNYAHYSIQGIMIRYVPSSISALFADAVVPPDLTARVNSISTLEIVDNQKGKVLGRGFFVGRVNVAFILLGIGTLLVLVFGYETLHNRPFQKFMSGFRLSPWALLGRAGGRFFMAAAGVVIMGGLILLYINLRGVRFSPTDYRGFFYLMAVTLVVFLVYFVSGILFSMIRSQNLSRVALLGSWILLTIFIPGLFISSLDNRFPDSVRDLEAAVNKLATLTEFEENLKKEHGKFDRNRLDLFASLAEKYLKEVFPRIVDQEKEILQEIEQASEGARKLFILTPATFFLITCNEVSSRGYENFLDFYRYTIKVMEDFSRFWVDRVFYNDVKKVVNFITDNQDLFLSESKRPKYFWAGLWLHLGFIVGLLVLLYFMYYRYLYIRARRPEQFNKVVIEFASGEVYGYPGAYEEFLEQLFNRFSGGAPLLKMKISIDGREVDGGIGCKAVYLPTPETFPQEIKGCYLLRFMRRLYQVPDAEVEEFKSQLGKEVLNKRLCKLDKRKKVEVMARVARLSNSTVYLLDDTFAGFHLDKPAEGIGKPDLKKLLKAEEALIVDLSVRQPFIVADKYSIFLPDDDLFYVDYLSGKGVR